MPYENSLLPKPSDATRTIRLLLAETLKAQGYAGLCHPDTECGCPVDDLAPCEGTCMDCQPAYKGKPPLETEETPNHPDGTWFYNSKAAADASLGKPEKPRGFDGAGNDICADHKPGCWCFVCSGRRNPEYKSPPRKPPTG